MVTPDKHGNHRLLNNYCATAANGELLVGFALALKVDDRHRSAVLLRIHHHAWRRNRDRVEEAMECSDDPFYDQSLFDGGI